MTSQQQMASSSGVCGPAAGPGTRPGILSHQRIRTLIEAGMLSASQEFGARQIQPASLDLRLGPVAYRVRASFLPGPERSVDELLHELRFDEIDLERGAVLERGCVYVVPLQERLNLPAHISALANPKSSTGRLDVFTRLITDRTQAFDNVALGYSGPLYAEISPRTFSIRAKTGSTLNQIRFRLHDRDQEEGANPRLSDRELRALHELHRLVDGEASIRDGLILRVALCERDGSDIIGYRAQTFTDIVDIDRVGAHRVCDYWEPLHARADRRLILDPHQFYILASRERLGIPPMVAAEMVPIDPMMGEFRVHYAGFFDPGFGYAPGGMPSSRGVLEVRSHEVPFILQDGQMIGRLVYEHLTEEPEQLYGRELASNYQGQGLKLSKHFCE